MEKLRIISLLIYGQRRPLCAFNKKNVRPFYSQRLTIFGDFLGDKQIMFLKN